MMFDIGKNSVKDYLEVKKITSSPHPSLEQAIMLMAKGLGNEKHATWPHLFIMLPSISVRQESPYLDFKLMNHLSSLSKHKGLLLRTRGWNLVSLWIHKQGQYVKRRQVMGFSEESLVPKCINFSFNWGKRALYLKNPEKFIFLNCVQMLIVSNKLIDILAISYIWTPIHWHWDHFYSMISLEAHTHPHTH